MTLHEAIQAVLKEHNHPMRAKDIADAINQKGYYARNDREPLQTSQVYARVRKYPLLLENINGLITLAENPRWKMINEGYLYLKENLRGVFSDDDIQYIIAVLFFYKRLLDINDRPGRKYPIDFLHYDDALDTRADRWAEKIREIERFHIAPEGVFDEISALLQRIDHLKRRGILSIITRIDTSPFDDLAFGNIYEYFLYQNARELSGYDHSTPETVRNLIPELLQVKEGGIVYDPVAAVGGLLSKVYSLHKKVLLQGSEITKRIAQLGNMNLMMYGYNHNNTIDDKDCFNELNSDKQFDFIIGDLPINGVANSSETRTLYNRFGLQMSKSEKGFGPLVLFSYDKLSYEGKAVITVSESFLTKSGKEKEIRRILVDDDVVETVISLPKGTYRPYTEAKSSILILNKHKPAYLKEKIKFIRANVVLEDKKSLLLDIDQVLKEYQEEIPGNKPIPIISIRDVRDDLNLSAEVYDTQFFLGDQMLKEGTAKHLKDVTHIRSGVLPVKEESPVEGELAVIKVENLSKDILDINLDVHTVSSKTYNSHKNTRAIIRQKCVLIAKIGDSLKPTIFLPTPEYPEILLHTNILALIPKDETLNLEYLYYSLYSPFVIEQLESTAKKKGALIPFLNKKDIEDIIIPLESLASQASFVQTQKASLIATENRRLEEKKRMMGYEEESREAEINIVRTITHQLKHNLTGIDALIRKIAAIVHKNGIGAATEYNPDDPILLNQEGFEPPENDTLKQTVDKALKKSTLLNQILTDVKKAIHLEMKFTDENLFTLFNDLKNEFKDIFIDVKGDRSLILRISKSHMEDLLDTLINNAIQHGGLSKETLRISFTIKKEPAAIKIEYRNNGRPIGISEKDFKSIATKSQYSTGTGVGGYYINKIIEAHSGSLKVDTDVNSGVQMIIELPLNTDANE
ncbi:N-6 DNA methylase [uncultured Dysgonomonas sp.]|uniref:N-6 DNA methylase n=1 Tax=uncultured Dysgonomonas sp. TaxID=206096 RepID=UPI000A9A8E52|nr:N-6 DNA methylase [uncultured Dysgonomonas sp.]